MISKEMYLFSLPGFPSECLISAGFYWQEKQAQLFSGSSHKHLTSHMISKEMYLFSLPGFPSECLTSAGFYLQEKQAQLFGGSLPKPLPLFHITCCLPLTCIAGQSDSERLL